jgi:hypothetical protein
MATQKIQDHDIAVIQVYSPRAWHDNQALVMNEPGRQRLLQALGAGKVRIGVEAITQDGEGYELAVICQDWDTILRTMQEPYMPDPQMGLTIDETKQDPRYMVTEEDPRILNISLRERITQQVVAWLWPSAKDHYKFECNCDLCRFVRVVAGHEARRLEGK